MKTIDEKVAVYRAWLEGKPIQVVRGGGAAWEGTAKPSWDWYIYDYRVKPEPAKPAVAKAYIHTAGFVQWAVNDYFDNEPNYTRAPEFDIVAKLPDSSK